jgi:hypothetical protein
MKRFLLATVAALTLAAGTLMTPASADAQPYRYRGGYGYRPYYGNYYRPYVYPRYYAPPRYYSGYYGYPRYRYPGYYYGPRYYGSPYGRSAGVYLGAPGVGVYVR